VADLRGAEWQKRGRGCWPSLAPDNSGLLWIFEGAHRNVFLSLPGGKEPWEVALDNAPGAAGFEVYHPRWSNHVRFMTMTGPYRGRKVGANRIRSGGQAVEVYVGRFDGSFSRIEQWVQITHNERTDLYPDVWIAGGEHSSVAETFKRARDPRESPPIAADGKATETWPGKREGLVFLWENARAQNRIKDPRKTARRECRVRATGAARYGRFYDMDLAGGAIRAVDADAALLDACRATGCLTVEAAVTAADTGRAQPACVVTFSANGRQRNFTLGQHGDRLVFALRTTGTGLNGISPPVTLGRIEAGRMVHVLVSYRPGLLVGYLNGKQVIAGTDIAGDLDNWTQQHLLFGSEATGDCDWAGRLEGIAIFNRFVGADEARGRYGLHLARIGTRRRADRIRIEGRLLELSPTPSLRDIHPYRRCLAAYAYEVEKALQGTCQAEEIIVYHWVILDGEILPPKHREGDLCTLTLEPFKQHPQLRSERRSLDLDDPALPAYYDVAR
jgi:hypothetical protein